MLKEGICVLRTPSTESHYLNGLLHRDRKPAMVNREGMFWYQNGLLHREDGPACVYRDCNSSRSVRCWYRHGLLHKELAPAIERDDGSEEWWENGTVRLDEREIRTRRIRKNLSFF